MSLHPTFFGHVHTTQDALLIFEACRRDIVKPITRRPHDREREQAIRSGCIFVFNEIQTGIKRWTDGVAWSPSRIMGNFLLYRELERRFAPGERKRQIKPSRPKPDRTTTTLVTPERGSRGEGSGSHHRRSASVGSPPVGTAAPYRYTSSGQSSELDFPEPDTDRALVGSLTDTYGFKEGGLIKKTMSLIVDGQPHHLISYYSAEDVKDGVLATPSKSAMFAGVQIPADLVMQQNFRVPPVLDDKATAFDMVRPSAQEEVPSPAPIVRSQAVQGMNTPFRSQTFPGHSRTRSLMSPLRGGGVTSPTSDLPSPIPSPRRTKFSQILEMSHGSSPGSSALPSPTQATPYDRPSPAGSGFFSLRGRMQLAPLEIAKSVPSQTSSTLSGFPANVPVPSPSLSSTYAGSQSGSQRFARDYYSTPGRGVGRRPALIPLSNENPESNTPTQLMPVTTPLNESPRASFFPPFMPTRQESSLNDPLSAASSSSASASQPSPLQPTFQMGSMESQSTMHGQAMAYHQSQSGMAPGYEFPPRQGSVPSYTYYSSSTPTQQTGNYWNLPERPNMGQPMGAMSTQPGTSTDYEGYATSGNTGMSQLPMQHVQQNEQHPSEQYQAPTAPSNQGDVNYERQQQVRTIPQRESYARARQERWPNQQHMGRGGGGGGGQQQG
ncbi:Global transcription regulator sge1 [Saitoella coloradoensis]